MLNWLNNKVLSASQWIILSLAGALGAAVTLLRLEKSRLHRTQIDLLRKSIELDTKEDDERVKKALVAYAQALKKFHDIDE